jgi:hypothetical protein
MQVKQYSRHLSRRSLTGPRIEAHAGYDHVTAKLKYEDTAFPDDNVTAKESHGLAGWVKRLTLGTDGSLFRL